MIFRRRTRTRKPQVTLEPHPDDLPKRGLFAEPIRLSQLQPLDPEPRDLGQHRVTFLVEVKDSLDARCPNLAVEATVTGPHRSATVQTNTDMLGRARFRMEGPAGRYSIHVNTVAPGGLDWDTEAGPRQAEIDVP